MASDAAQALERAFRAVGISVVDVTPSDDLCEDCPPIGYPTDRTRCLPCPRRATQLWQGIASAPGATAAITQCQIF
jgi:hypothetical protein